MSRRIRRAARATVALLIAAASRPHRLTAQEKTPLVVFETRLAGHGGTQFRARNQSRDTVWVDSLLIHNCQNVALADCRGHALNIAVAPDSTRVVFTLHPTEIGPAFNYRWSYTWHVLVMDSSEVRRDVR